MNEVYLPFIRCLVHYFNVLKFPSNSEEIEIGGEENRELLRERGEQFLEATKTILQKVKRYGPRWAKHFPEEYKNIRDEVSFRLQLHGSQLRPQTEEVLVFCAYCRRFLDEVLEPWRESFLQSVNLSEQVQFMENELMHELLEPWRKNLLQSVNLFGQLHFMNTELMNEKMPEIRAYKLLFSEVLNHDASVHRDPLSELHPPQQHLERLINICLNSEAYIQAAKCNDKWNVQNMNLIVVDPGAMSTMLGNVVDAHRRALAMAMGQHRRLGNTGASPFSLLSDDLMQSIARKAL